MEERVAEPPTAWLLTPPHPPPVGSGNPSTNTKQKGPLIQGTSNMKGPLIQWTSNIKGPLIQGTSNIKG